jgi:hypothetical protein
MGDVFDLGARQSGHARMIAAAGPSGRKSHVQLAARGMVARTARRDHPGVDEALSNDPEVRLTIQTACLSCGTPARSHQSTFCGRCGRPFGAEPPAHVELPSCPVCYQSAGDDGRFGSHLVPGRRLDLPHHVGEHDRAPVGDDDYLESLREGSQIRIGRWTAPFDLVRRYLVTGSLDGGRRRQYEHDLIVTAMTQLARFGPEAVILGDQPEWRAARDAVAELMERFHRLPGRPRLS